MNEERAAFFSHKRERAGGGKNGKIPPGTWKGDAVSKGKRNMNFEKKNGARMKTDAPARPV